jgi:RNA polymerase sigma-70 factor (ECF subfamily)
LMHSLEKARQEKLLRRAQRGDADAFEALVAPYEQKIYALCFRLMAQREDAQDAAQETMIRIYRSLGDYRGDAQLGTFIYRVATNACMDALRKRRVRAGESLEALSEEGFVPADRAPGPEETLLRSERGEAISKAIQALSEEMRLPFVLRELHGLSYEEVAQTLDIGMGTVKSRIHRAREKLVRALSASRDEERKTGKGGRGA